MSYELSQELNHWQKRNQVSMFWSQNRPSTSPLGDGRLEDIPRDSLRAGGVRPGHTVVRLMRNLNQIGNLHCYLIKPWYLNYDFQYCPRIRAMVKRQGPGGQVSQDPEGHRQNKWQNSCRGGL